MYMGANAYVSTFEDVDNFILSNNATRVFAASWGAQEDLYIMDQAECVPGATSVKLAPDGEIKRVILCSGKFLRPDGRAREEKRDAHPDAAPGTTLPLPGSTDG